MEKESKEKEREKEEEEEGERETSAVTHSAGFVGIAHPAVEDREHQ